MEDPSFIDALIKGITDNLTASALIGAVIAFLGGTGVFTFLRRSKKPSQGEAAYFMDKNLLAPPLARPAYSDRMAYVLAEMSALAYYEFEGTGGVLRDAAKNFLQLTMKNEQEVEKWLNDVADKLLIKGVDSIEFFQEIIETAGYKLLRTINVSETQGFVCKRVAPDEPPYIVVAFRGTEQKISDWLTDADAVPTVDGDTRVHTGFLEALTVKSDEGGRTVLNIVEETLDGPDAQDESGNALPLFITGHSLGGALALLTTRELADDVVGACYTYGAPRVANYEYFDGMKTPVFRVVNSVDIVPRVPPGASMQIILKLVQMLSWLASVAGPIKRLLEKLESFLDKLNGYRHFGDQRYLTDVETGRFQDVRLLSNPPAIDRLMWMWQHVGISSRFLAPVKSHGMAIYRKKLQYLANSRNTKQD